MNTQYDVTVVIAEESARENLAEIIKLLDPPMHPQVEFIICSAVTGQPEYAGLNGQNVRYLVGRGRIPLLWRDGILAAKADTVALTTAHCLPEPDWLDRLLQVRLAGELVAVGGAIGEGSGDGVLSRAIYLLRYFPFRPSRPAGEVSEIAADNALYRRSAILEHPDLLELGFWEPSFHKRFRGQGLVLRFDPKLLVSHYNHYSISQFWGQRVDHGGAFGRDRAAAMSRRRLLLMVVCSPAIPLVFFAKILVGLYRDEGFRPAVLTSLPLLFLFVCGWSWGESTAYWQRFFRPVSQ